MQIVDRESHVSYLEELERHLRQYYGATLGLPPSDVERRIVGRVARKRGEGFAEVIDEFVPLRGKRLLDVGCGWGELVLSCLSRGANAQGVEPNEDEVRISRLLLRSYGLDPSIRQGSGEELPFGDEEFDIVTCQQVLEHVSDINQVVAEMVRVTRRGGFIVASVPNYLFPYEGHYSIKWFPLLPKPLGAVLLRMKGRDPTFLLNHVNYTTYPRMMRIWRRHGLAIRNITRELLESDRHKSRIYERRIVRALALHLNVFPNVTWLLQRPDRPAR